MVNPNKLKWNHVDMLRRRGLDPRLYTFVKETNSSVYFRHIHTGVLKIIEKGMRYG